MFRAKGGRPREERDRGSNQLLTEEGASRSAEQMTSERGGGSRRRSSEAAGRLRPNGSGSRRYPPPSRKSTLAVTTPEKPRSHLRARTAWRPWSESLVSRNLLGGTFSWSGERGIDEQVRASLQVLFSLGNGEWDSSISRSPRPRAGAEDDAELLGHLGRFCRTRGDVALR